MKDMTLRNEVEDVIRKYFGEDVEMLGEHQHGAEDMAMEILRLRKENARLGWIESPDRMGS